MGSCRNEVPAESQNGYRTGMFDPFFFNAMAGDGVITEKRKADCFRMGLYVFAGGNFADFEDIKTNRSDLTGRRYLFADG